MSNQKKILIVDDDADDREILRDAFLHTARQFSLDCAFAFFESGDALIQHLESRASGEMPNLILLDLNMPGKDGRETLKVIKQSPHFHAIPTVVFTTSSSSRDRLMAYDLGANCFLTKPDTFHKLTALADSIGALWLM